MRPIVKNGIKLKWKFENIRKLDEKGMWSDKISTGPIDWKFHIYKVDGPTKNFLVVLCYDSENKKDSNWICGVDGISRILSNNGTAKHFRNPIHHPQMLFYGCANTKLHWCYYGDFDKNDSLIIDIHLNFHYYDFSKIIPNFTDLTIIVENTEFHVNKGFLCAHSKYFYNLFIVEESKETELRIEDVSPMDFSFLLVSPQFIRTFDSMSNCSTYNSLLEKHHDAVLMLIQLLLENHNVILKFLRTFDVPSLHRIFEQQMGTLFSERRVLIKGIVSRIEMFKCADENDYEQLMQKCIKSLETPEDVIKIQESPEFSKFKKTTQLRIMTRMLDFY